MKSRRWRGTVLAIHANAYGLGYVVMESPLSPIDWGIHVVRKGEKNPQCLEKVANLIEMQRPDVIALDEITEQEARKRRRGRVRKLNRAIEKLAATNNIDSYRYPHALVERCFASLGAQTWYEIAEVIAKHVPALSAHLPPRRRKWESESPQMTIFKAAALAFSFFGFDAGLQLPTGPISEEGAAE